MRLAYLITGLLVALNCVPNARADAFGSGTSTFDIEFVTIGNPGNPGRSSAQLGKVDYSFRLAKFETSRDMFAKANNLGKLDFNGVNLPLQFANRPVTATWNRVARFVNWLNTSEGFHPAYKFAAQPGDGNYNNNAPIQFWSPGDAGYDPSNRFRNRLAKYFLPSTNEWFKAAYYNPSTGTYSDYPVAGVGIPDGIDFPGDTQFDAVVNDCHCVIESYAITDVGRPSYYGTFGQGGNAWELMEQYETRGGRFSSLATDTHAGIHAPIIPSFDNTSGFRVASLVPEPSAIFLAILGLMALPRKRLP